MNVACGPGKVPGWLDEHGQATSCVDDNPTPGVLKLAPAVAQEVAPVPPGAVDTGLLVADPVGGGLGVALVLAGAVCWLRERVLARRRERGLDAGSAAPKVCS